MSDYELLMLSLEGNEEANSVLDQKYIKVIKSIINKYKYLINKRKMDYDDIFNECLCIYYQGKLDYNEYSCASFYTYISLIIKRRLFKLFRPLIDLDTSDYSVEPTNSLHPLNILIKEENIKELNEIILTKFDKLEKQIILLLINNLSYKDIAIKLNKSYRQIYWAVLNMRKKIRN